MTYPVFSDTHKHVNVFPYSIFYVFYEQYLTMVEDTAFSLAISLSSVFVVTFVLGGFDIKTAIVTTFTIILILVSILLNCFHVEYAKKWNFMYNSPFT